MFEEEEKLGKKNMESSPDNFEIETPFDCLKLILEE